MKCVLNGQNAGILAKAIHSFARIGCELYLEADSNAGLSLRTVNMTKSAFASISFNRDFFSSFIVKSKNIEDNQCKLSMKSCVGVFRNMKQVESCTISLNSESYKLIVQFRCRLETIRTHHVSILEHETLQASYFTDRSLNTIGGNHKLFSNIITNFKSNEEELSIKATEKDVVVQNYADGTHVDNRFVRSQITIKPEEFEKYKIGENTTITFCMRELRAILNFAESMNIDISANFDTAGKPIVFVIKDFDTFEANLVMSTLSPEDIEFECQRSRSMVQSNLQNSTTDNIVLDKTNVDHNDGDAAIDDNADVAIAANKEPDSHEEDEPNNGIVHAKKRNHLLASFSSDIFASNSSKHASLDIVLRTKKRRTSTEHRRDTHIPSSNGTQATNHTEKSPPPAPHMDLDSENIDVVFQNDSSDPNDSLAVNNNGIEIMDVDMNPNINVRDHRPKMRQVFKRCFTQNTPASDPFGQILVAESDDEQ